jgi:hypothetical protein
MSLILCFRYVNQVFPPILEKSRISFTIPQGMGLINGNHMFSLIPV